MAGNVYERRWPVRLEAFIADGTVDGMVTVADTSGFFVKQKVFVTATGLDNLSLEIKRVISDTEMFVGPTVNHLKKTDRRQQGKGISIDSRTDVTAYTLALSAQISAREQIRPNISSEYVIRAVYQEEPAVALRVMSVDKLGNPVGGSGGVSSDVNITSWGGTATSLGQKVMGASVPVVISSNQSVLPVSLDADLEDTVPQFIEVGSAAVVGTTPGTATIMMTLVKDMTMVVIRNTLNKRIGITIDNAQWLQLSPLQGGIFNLGSNGKKIDIGSAIGIFYESNQPSRGEIVVSMI